MKIYNHSKYNYVTIVEIPQEEISMIDMDMCAEPRQTLKNYYDKCNIKPDIICNGGFFNMDNGKSTLTFKEDGVIQSYDSAHLEGIGLCDKKTLTFGTLSQYPYEDFVSAYPLLIKNGQKAKITTASEINYKARRTILAYNGLYVYIIAIESPGMNFTEMQNMLMGMNVNYAINLDGGGSTKILHNGKSITSTLNNRAVDNVIAVYLNPQKIYKVQVGAFKLKCNADKYLQEVLKKLNYNSGFVVKSNGLYKVQLGAFKDKKNALNLANTAKSFGYDAYIVSV